MNARSHDHAVVVGRFEPPHAGHFVLFRQGLERAATLSIVLGSAHAARSPRNPFTWREREAMIRLGLTGQENERVSIIPVRDYYDDERWVAAVREGVATHAPQARRIVVVGHFKDHSSYYLGLFRPWDLVEHPMQVSLDATTLREILYTSSAPAIGLMAVGDLMPEPVRVFLESWTRLPVLRSLSEEYAMLQAEKTAWASAPYPPIFSTVDVLATWQEHVLLIRRGRHPGRGLLALPGGFVEVHETVYRSALRELAEETNLGVLPDMLRTNLKAVRVFDHPYRSERGRVITHLHQFDLSSARHMPEVAAGDDAAPGSAQWIPLVTVPGLEEEFFGDHFHIIDEMLHVSPRQTDRDGSERA